MNIAVLNLANWEQFVTLEKKKETSVIIINKGSFLMKYLETVAFPWQPQCYMHTASPVPTVTRYYSTSLIHWMCKTFNFPATTEAGPGGERGEESRGAKRHLTGFITRARCVLWLASQSPNQVPLHPVVENTIGWWGKELCAKPTPLLTLALQKPS